MQEKLYICGCSHSTGFYLINPDASKVGYNKSFATIIANNLLLEPVPLAEDGASNYFIIKQILFALEQNAKYILINIAPSMRFDWVSDGKLLDDIPTYKDFISKNNRHRDQKIKSAAFRSITHYLKNSELSRLVANYLDPKIRLDQDKWMLHGIFSYLNSQNIKYIAVNCTTNNFSETYITPIHSKSSWEEIVNTFPEKTDQYHLNQEGHNFVAQCLLPTIRNHFFS